MDRCKTNDISCDPSRDSNGDLEDVAEGMWDGPNFSDQDLIYFLGINLK